MINFKVREARGCFAIKLHEATPRFIDHSSILFALRGWEILIACIGLTQKFPENLWRKSNSEPKGCIEIPRTVLIFSDIARIAINMLQFFTEKM